MTNRARTIGTGFATLTLVASLAACGLSPVPFGDEEAKTTETPTETEPRPADNDGQTSVPIGEYEDVADGYAMTDMATESYMPYYEEPEFNTEEYATIEESGFVSTLSTPLSTVSADVDTASYANLRRMLMAGYKVASKEDEADTTSSDSDVDGEEMRYEYPDQWEDEWYYESNQMIPTGAVRIEEMLNYFNYDYEAPTGDDDFAISARVGACPWNDDTELLVLGYSTAPEDTSVREKGANLVFLIDVSGSMDDPDKLPLLQSSFGELVDQLGENDLVSIVTYSGEEEVVLEAESGANKREIMKAIRSLKADGSTNGEAGLRMAYEIAEKNYIEGGVNRIVMASDGDLNVGMTSDSDLHDFVSKKRESGVYLSVLGFGAGNYKDTKMETLADDGNGQYHYIDCEAEANRVFGERLCANLVPFANDVKVQVEFNPAQIKGYRLIGYENRTMAAEDFENDEKDAGEVGPESQFTVVYEIVRADSAMDIPTPELKYETSDVSDSASNEWLTAKLRYKSLGEDEAKEQELVVSEQDLSDDPGDDWRFAAAVTEFGMLLRDSEYKGTSTYDTVRDLVGKTTDEARVEFLDLVDLAENN